MTLAAIGALFKRIPAWGWVALLCVAGLWFFGRYQKEQGREEVMAEWAKAIEEAKAAAQATEQAWAKAVWDLAYKAEAKRIERERETESTIADIRSGALSLRERFKCPAMPKAPGVPGKAKEEEPYGLRGADAEFLIRFADEADQYSEERNECVEIGEVTRNEAPKSGL